MFLDPSFWMRAANTTFNAAAESSQTVLQCKDIDHCRTLQSIIYGSFSTVFLCTWTALHLDLPYPPLFKRVWWMMVALIAPEVVFWDALSDWVISSELLGTILVNYPDCGWTETHAQFVRMGGFRLVGANGKSFLDCVEDGTIDLPKLSKDDVLRRSKGDLITKIFTVIQTAWFVVQCMHRLSQDLLLTQLEITTLAHTLMNFFIYFFWWHKPHGVDVPIEVLYKERAGSSYYNIQVPRTKNRTTRPLLISNQTSPQFSSYTRLGIKTFSVRNQAQLSMFGRIVLNTICFIVGGGFGAIHCLSWRSAFPTRAEDYIWHVSSLTVTVIGGTMLVYLVNGREVNAFLIQKGTAGRLAIFLITIPLLIYCLARLSLLVLALFQLRALPYAAYATPSWSTFYPHIG